MKNTIDDAIFTASPEITYYRYNPLMGILLTAASIAGLWAYANSTYFEEHEVLGQWTLLLSGTVLCTGLTMICYRLFGDSSSPVEKTSRERLYRSEYSFEINYLPKVVAAIEQGDFTLLQKLPRSYQPSTQVVCYRTDSGSLIAAQVLKNHEPAGPIQVFRQGEYAY